MCRTECKECPYKVKSQNNTKILDFVNRTNRQHKCHMIDSKIWNDVTDDNICIGNKDKIKW